MPRTPAHPSASTSQSNCHQNCHSGDLEWWMVRDGTKARANSQDVTQELLRARIKFHASSGCWEYTGAHDAHGYGRIFVAGKETKAQRVYFEVFVGPLPKGARLRHFLSNTKCIGAACCNPSHLKVEQSFSGIKFARRVCPKGHLVDADNAVIENRGPNLLVRCRACRQLEWRTLKRRKNQSKPPVGPFAVG